MARAEAQAHRAAHLVAVQVAAAWVAPQGAAQAVAPVIWAQGAAPLAAWAEAQAAAPVEWVAPQEVLPAEWVEEARMVEAPVEVPAGQAAHRVARGVPVGAAVTVAAPLVAALTEVLQGEAAPRVDHPAEVAKVEALIGAAQVVGHPAVAWAVPPGAARAAHLEVRPAVVEAKALAHQAAEPQIEAVPVEAWGALAGVVPLVAEVAPIGVALRADPPEVEAAPTEVAHLEAVPVAEAIRQVVARPKVPLVEVPAAVGHPVEAAEATHKCSYLPPV